MAQQEKGRHSHASGSSVRRVVRWEMSSLCLTSLLSVYTCRHVLETTGRGLGQIATPPRCRSTPNCERAGGGAWLATRMSCRSLVSQDRVRERCSCVTLARARFDGTRLFMTVSPKVESFGCHLQALAHARDARVRVCTRVRRIYTHICGMASPTS